MAKLTIRVDRDPAKQPTWARKFLEEHFLQAHVYKKIAGTVQSLNAQFAKEQPFEPPVTLRYTDEHDWEFTWATEAEYTMFLLKWA